MGPPQGVPVLLWLVGLWREKLAWWPFLVGLSSWGSDLGVIIGDSGSLLSSHFLSTGIWGAGEQPCRGQMRMCWRMLKSKKTDEFGVLRMNHLTNYIFIIKAVFELQECKKAYECVVLQGPFLFTWLIPNGPTELFIAKLVPGWGPVSQTTFSLELTLCPRGLSCQCSMTDAGDSVQPLLPGVPWV